MASKRPASPDLGFIANPFIKKRNLDWTLDPPSPSKPDDTHGHENPTHASPPPSQQPTTAAVEAGTAHIEDHLAHFTSHLTKYALPPSPSTPRLPTQSYAALYESQAGSPLGAHFVIHQHDHPVAGTHYDLRLQINETSSASWAVMYGLPGDPNSDRLARNATETRVHCLWNHLIETASASTGSLLIWDTGTYTILPRQSKHSPAADPSSPPSSPSSSASASSPSPQALLHAAFQNRKIRLRLHGTRLPDPYVLNLRLTKSEDAAGRARSRRTSRGRRRAATAAVTRPETSSESDSSEKDTDAMPADGATDAPGEDEHVRRTNAYPGAANTIGSVHQRRWYLSLDRPACGFVELRRGGGGLTWEKPRSAGEDTRAVDGCRYTWPFYVRGADHERSVVTGRTGGDILRDEGVKGFVARKGWMPVLN